MLTTDRGTRVCLLVAFLLCAVHAAAQEPAALHHTFFEVPDGNQSTSGVVAGEPGGAGALARSTRPAALMPLYFSLVTVQALDIHSTIEGRRRGFRETNPLLGAMDAPAALIALKSGSIAASVYLTEKLWKRNRAAAVLTMIGVNSAYAVIVAHNYAIGR